MRGSESTEASTACVSYPNMELLADRLAEAETLSHVADRACSVIPCE
jgi:hypothetical protein